jgi:hypothetical protein
MAIARPLAGHGSARDACHGSLSTRWNDASLSGEGATMAWSAYLLAGLPIRRRLRSVSTFTKIPR